MRRLIEQLELLEDRISEGLAKSMRKAWDKQIKDRKYTSVDDVSEHLNSVLGWISALWKDLSFKKGLFQFHGELPSVSKDIPEKFRAKMQEIRNNSVLRSGVQEYLGGMRSAIRGASKRIDMELEKINKEKVFGYDRDDDEKSKNLKGAIGQLGRGFARANAQAIMMFRKIGKMAESGVDLGTFEREFSIGRAKVVMQDLPDRVGLQDRRYKMSGVTMRHPDTSRNYVKIMSKAKALLEKKGLGFLWYGPFFVKADADVNDFVASYHPHRDTVDLIGYPHDYFYKVIVHELGHRLWFKFMNKQDRGRFAEYFGKVKAVSDYGGTNAEEDFAEVFMDYIDGKKLTRDQVERFKSFARVKGGRKIRDDVHTRLDMMISEVTKTVSIPSHMRAPKGSYERPSGPGDAKATGDRSRWKKGRERDEQADKARRSKIKQVTAERAKSKEASLETGKKSANKDRKVKKKEGFFKRLARTFRGMHGDRKLRKLAKSLDDHLTERVAGNSGAGGETVSMTLPDDSGPFRVGRKKSKVKKTLIPRAIETGNDPGPNRDFKVESKGTGT